ncbi:BTB/POZ protein [Lactifluus subvellereus]|nr:BTB/POZ protein [Lactifluus subvellereus]
MSTQPQSPAQDDWIRVTSRDGFSFIVKRNVVFRSGTLRNMLDERHSFTEAVQKVCPVDERAAVTEKFVEYLAYKATYENVPPNEEIPDFFERIDPEIALELYVRLPVRVVSMYMNSFLAYLSLTISRVRIE